MNDIIPHIVSYLPFYHGVNLIATCKTFYHLHYVIHDEITNKQQIAHHSHQEWFVRVREIIKEYFNDFCTYIYFEPTYESHPAKYEYIRFAHCLKFIFAYDNMSYHLPHFSKQSRIMVFEECYEGFMRKMMRTNRLLEHVTIHNTQISKCMILPDITGFMCFNVNCTHNARIVLPHTLCELECDHYEMCDDKSLSLRILNTKYLKGDTRYNAAIEQLRVNIITSCPVSYFSKHLIRLIICNYNCPFNVPFPESLEYLELRNYNQLFTYALPANLKVLKLHHFNQRITLPHALVELHMTKFNQPFDIPNQLQLLNLKYYNQSFTQAFPSSLKYMYLQRYKQSFDFVWPNLETLELGQYNQPFEFAWPESLKRLVLTFYDHDWLRPWPSQLVYLRMLRMKSQYCSDFPKTLVIVEINGVKFKS